MPLGERSGMASEEAPHSRPRSHLCPVPSLCDLEHSRPGGETGAGWPVARWLGALTACLRGGTGPPGRPGWRWRHDAVHDGPGAVGVPALEAGEGEDRPGAAAETPQAHRPVAAGVGCREDGRDVSVLSGSSTLTPDLTPSSPRPVCRVRGHHHQIPGTSNHFLVSAGQLGSADPRRAP